MKANGRPWWWGLIAWTNWAKEFEVTQRNVDVADRLERVADRLESVAVLQEQRIREGQGGELGVHEG